jgi:hypothetical protein
MSGKSLMHGQGESYSGIVPTKQPNQGGEPPAEVVEGRPLTKENTPQGKTDRIQAQAAENCRSREPTGGLELPSFKTGKLPESRERALRLVQTP